MKTAVTGWGVRLPLGASVDKVVSRLLEGERAARANSLFDATGFACTLAAVCAAPRPPSRSRRYVRRPGLLGMEAADDAMAMAQPVRGERLGVFVGYGGLRADWDNLMRSFSGQREDGQRSWELGFAQLHPHWMLSHLSNNAHAILSMELDARGDGLTLGGVNAGAQALAAAGRALEAGSIDAALVVAYDTLLEPETLLDLGAKGLATSATLATLAAPYDIDARGFVPGEGAAAVVLERDGEHPLARIEVLDGADGAAGLPLIATLAARASALASEPVCLLDGAGFGQPDVDAAERAALAQLLGDLPLTSTSSALGQLGAATAVAQVILLASCLRRGLLPPVAGLRSGAAGSLRPLVLAEATRGRAALALSGGTPGLCGVVRTEVA